MRRLILAGLLICLCGAVAAASAQLLTTHAGTAIPAGGGGGGGTIAFVNAVDGGNNGGSTNSLTYSYTATTGPHSLLVVCVAGDTSADDVTGVTYNSLPMTLAVKSIGTPTLRYTYTYYLVAASGWGGTSHNVVMSANCAEQNWSNFFSVAGYIDLYMMASYGPNRRQFQILNYSDDCCFGNSIFAGSGAASFYEVNFATYMRNYIVGVKQKEAVVMPVHYDGMIDYIADQHQISANAQSAILSILGSAGPGSAGGGRRLFHMW
ncbi:MAG TPA: hypothetical protein VJX94_15630 [Stellaceae bacterium]|nr:hypothetical protein [Stellaceae bacterium]